MQGRLHSGRPGRTLKILTRLAHFTVLATGPVRLGLAVLSGGIAALSLPPFFVLPALFIGLPLLVWLLDGIDSDLSLVQRLFGPAFLIGWGFGFGWFAVSLHWVGFAFIHEGSELYWAVPLAPLVLAAALALFFAVGTVIAHFFWSEGGHRIFALAAALSLTEFLRGHVLSGFPWNLPGYALTASEPGMQIGALMGIYGMTLVVLVLGATPALCWPASEASALRRFAPALWAALALVAVFAFGGIRLAMTDVGLHEDIRLRLVDPAQDQASKWLPGNEEAVFARLLQASDPMGTGLEGITHLIWPESAFPYFLAERADSLARLSRFLPAGTLLITGAMRAPPDSTSNSTDLPPVTATNGIIALNDVGEVVAAYDKRRLVPFGEYLPFMELLAQFGVDKLVPVVSAFAPGPAVQAPFAPYDTPPLLPLVCYEVIFSGALGERSGESDWILNLTNDAWFAGSIGPAQHFAHARLRAVEEGKPLVRVANRGVSSIIDPLGRISGRLAGTDAAFLDGVLPRPVNATIAARYKYALFLIVLASAAGMVIVRNNF